MPRGQSSKSKHPLEVPSRAQASVFWVNLSLLVLVPLVFSAAAYNSFVLPRFVVLLIGTSASVSLLVLLARAPGVSFRQLKSKHALLFFGYVVAVVVSTIGGVDPVGSFAGGYRRMGVATALCFFVCFASLIVGIGSSSQRFERTLWAMVLTGAITAGYAAAQSFGYDPFIQSTLYTVTIEGETVVRAGSTFGHSNVLGNFLLYTTPVAFGLAFAFRGRGRAVALIATGLSTAAIILSGTRGAWLGLAIGAAIFFGVTRSKEVAPRQSSEHRFAGRAVVAFLVVVGVVCVIGWGRASRGVILRARSILTEHFTGAGRTILWRDAIRAVPSAAITGYGPESFTRVFPAFGTMALAKLSPLKSESSHNNYLDAAITEGLLGATLYAALNASTLLLLIRALRRVRTRRERFVLAGLVSAFVAVMIHNIFTYDQLSTGMYFFAFAALAQSATGLFNPKGFGPKADAHPKKGKERPIRTRLLTAGLAACLPALTVWYSLELVRADVEINDAFAAARAGDFNGVVAHGERATQVPELTGIYDFLLIQSLSLCIDHLKSRREEIEPVGRRALDVALAHADRASAHTLVPEWFNMLMAHLAIAARDADKLRQFATEAVKANPNHFYSRWLMAETFLLENDLDQAKTQANLALQLNPSWAPARSALERAGGYQRVYKRTIPELIERARKVMKAGYLSRSQGLLLRAVRRSAGPCPECHRALAYSYELARLFDKAIDEWRIVLEEDPERAIAEEVPSRIEKLSQGIVPPTVP